MKKNEQRKYRGTSQHKVFVVDKHKIGIKGAKNEKELKIRFA